MLSQELASKKSNVVAFILCSLFGILGLHRIYVGKYLSALIQFLSLGGFLVWTIVDCILILQEKFTDKEEKTLCWDKNMKGKYAGLKVRFAAHIIDSFIIFSSCYIAFSIIIPALSLSFKSSYTVLLTELEEIINIMISIIYYTYLTSSTKQATIGKQIVGIVVVSYNKQKLSLFHSLGRCFAYSFSYITLGIGFIMISFTRKNQALHDIVADTYVIYRRD